MNETITQAKAELDSDVASLIKRLDATPEDKLNWSPSETSRTPLQLVAHCAMALPGMQGMFEGKPFPFASMEELDKVLREDEKRFTTKEETVAFLASMCDEYKAWLDTLTEEQLNSMFTSPWMTLPMSVAITMPINHIKGHTAQLDYLQTIYGDHNWSM